MRSLRSSNSQLYVILEYRKAGLEQPLASAYVLYLYESY